MRQRIVYPFDQRHLLFTGTESATPINVACCPPRTAWQFCVASGNVEDVLAGGKSVEWEFNHAILLRLNHRGYSSLV
jgi:hypothetical protein